MIETTAEPDAGDEPPPIYSALPLGEAFTLCWRCNGALCGGRSSQTLGGMSPGSDNKRLMQKTLRHSAVLLVMFCCLRCSCAADPRQQELPHEITINKDAGRGALIFVPIRLSTGESFQFELDTGCPITILDKSLEPKLGNRVSFFSASFVGVKRSGDVRLAPQLYLGKVPLRSAFLDRVHTNAVATIDLQELAAKLHHPLMGILGMDCLQYYCIQIDFGKSKLRFLDPTNLHSSRLGQPFQLTFDEQGCPQIFDGPLLETRSNTATVDLGYYPGDGALKDTLLTAARAKFPSSAGYAATFCGTGLFEFSQCEWNGHTYTNLLIGEGATVIGLRFLARHLVTLDLPNARLYLKLRTAAPPRGDWYLNLKHQ
jgi:hypothetical protein